ncbi:MAG: hypothetical protein D6751_11230 [Deltaproteobacteria bacterium]|nr:MAG: hypothetical protein D6751_11230 [Deltaproteobacteria bacterium]
MGEETNLQDYLKGALAGTLIGRGSKALDQADPFVASKGAPVLELSVPMHIGVDQRVDLCVRLRNLGGRKARGSLVLRGEDVRTGTLYEFEAPLGAENDESGRLYVFSWKAPASATRIEWSATVQVEGRMGISIPTCSAATIVTSAPPSDKA